MISRPPIVGLPKEVSVWLSQVWQCLPRGGATAGRPTNAILYCYYFDTDLGLPIWWTGSAWVDSTGSTV